MTEEGGAADIWSDVRQRRYEGWWLHPDSGDVVVRTLLTLDIHALVLDAVAQGRPYTPAMIGRFRPASVAHAVTKRPDHELLAGLPALGEADRLRVDVLRILTCDDVPG